MNENLFLDNGAIITMANNHTHFFTEIDKTIGSGDNLLGKQVPSVNQPYFINPEFTLKALSQQIKFKSHSTQIFDVLCDHHDFNLKNEVSKSSEDKLTKGLNWISDINAYKEKYQNIMNFFKMGQLKKAVPFMTYKALKPKNFNQEVLPTIIQRLDKFKHPEEYLYGLWSEGKGFVGSTPEVLIQRKPNSADYNTMALAGTLPVNDSIDMLLDSKLAEEHKMVMQDIGKKLFDHEVYWDLPQEKKYKILKHIHAEATFSSDLDLKSLVERLSPTSALGVYPSENWRDYGDILGLDYRGSYGAPFGLVTDTELMVLVCLRGLFWDQDHLYIHVGGGVTAQSIYDQEIKELELKFLSTKTKLGI
jgi:isochorismate synthase